MQSEHRHAVCLGASNIPVVSTDAVLSSLLAAVGSATSKPRLRCSSMSGRATRPARSGSTGRSSPNRGDGTSASPRSATKPTMHRISERGKGAGRQRRGSDHRESDLRSERCLGPVRIDSSTVLCWISYCFCFCFAVLYCCLRDVHPLLYADLPAPSSESRPGPASLQARPGSQISRNCLRFRREGYLGHLTEPVGDKPLSCGCASPDVLLRSVRVSRGPSRPSSWDLQRPIC